MKKFRNREINCRQNKKELILPQKNKNNFNTKVYPKNQVLKIY